MTTLGTGESTAIDRGPNPARIRRGQLARLLQIVLALQSDRRPNARQLGDWCEVSRRTIFRDLDLIEMAGLRVEYDSVRRGYRLRTAATFFPPIPEVWRS